MRLKTRITKKWIFIILLIIVILPPVVDLIIVRQQTPTIVEWALHSKKCVLNVDSFDKKRIDILLKVEDPSFYENKGLDFHSLGAGLTTISQGVGKIFYFDNFKPGFRKIRLIFLTRFALYPLVSKRDVLQIFINYVYFGNYKSAEIRGFEQASNVYFNKRFHDISDEEYLSLVAMIINPNRFDLFNHKAQNKERVSRIKKLLTCKCRPNGWNDEELDGCK